MTLPPPFAHSIAIVIGIDRYANGIPELRTAANDAQRLATLLAEQHSYDVTTLIDADASRARLTELLTKELPARVGVDDRVLFYFAGHGVARDSDEGPNGYLLPADARRGDESTYLNMPLVHDALLGLSCRHMLVVLDSCFSGAFRWSGTRDAEEVVEVVHQEKYDRFVKDPAWQVITSASQDQKAIDQLSAGALGSRDGDGAHSPFALALFDGLSGKGDVIPREGGDGLVTATELYLYLDETLQSAALAAGKTQTPRLWPLKKHDKGEFVFFVPGRDLSLPPAPPLTFDNNPWRGLASHDATNATLFFGRDAETEALRKKVEANPLTVVLGASGTGKSSLVKAGVVPRLTAGGWLVLPIVRPGSTPLIALAQALSVDGQGSAGAATPESVTAVMQRLLDAQGDKKVVLVIDQFEELITLVPSGAERDRTLALLASLADAHADRLRIVVTIRTDFEPNFDRSAFGDRWREGRYNVPPMSRQNLRDVIEKPAAARVLYFDPSSLVDTLLDEVVTTPGALPLLSFALSEMYIAYVKRQSSDRAITRADYDGLGGVAGALRSRAESEYAALDAAHRATLRRVMLRLVTGEGGGLARRRVMDAELDFADMDEHARAANVVQRLTAARLLVEGKEPDGEAFVEPAHDALVRGWGRLMEWVREENEAKFALSQQQRLTRSATEWERADATSKSGLLWSDSSRSAQLAPLVRKKAPWLNRRELAFAQRSIRGRRITMATVAGALLTITAAGIVAIVGGLRASARAEQVRIGAIVRTATSMVTEDPMIAGLLLGSIDSAAVEKADAATRLAMLGAALELRRGPRVLATFNADDEVVAARISPDGRSVATAVIDNEVRIWRADGTGSPLVLRQPNMPVTAIEFSPSSDRLAVGDANGAIRIWPRTGPGAPVTLPGDATPVLRMQFSRDGRRLLVTYDVGAAKIWTTDGSGSPTEIQSKKIKYLVAGVSPETGKDMLTPAFVGVDEALFADGDRQVVTIMRDSSVQFWPSVGVAEPTRTVRLPRREEPTRIAVSPDGKRVAVGGRNAQLFVLDLGVKSRSLRLSGATGDIAALGWSPDGAMLVSTATDTGMLVWNTTSGERIRRFRHNGEAMQSADFSPDGRSIITTSPYSFQATIWSLDSAVVALPGQTNELVAADFAPDSRRVLTAAKDGSVRLWSLPDPPIYSERGGIESEHPEGGNIAAVAFSPDERTIAMSTLDGLMYQKRLDSVSMKRMIDSAPGTLRTLAFSPDGRRLRGLLYDGTRRLWTLGTIPSRADVPTSSTAFAITTEFAADGRHALSITDQGSALVWDVDTKSPPMTLQLLPADSICAGQDGDDDCADPLDSCAALSRDGQFAAACLRAGPAAIYRVPTTTPFRTITTPRSSRSTAVAFNSDASRIAVGYGNGSIRLFTVAGADTGRLIAGHRQAVKLLDFSPDGQRLLSAAKDGTVRVWDTATGTSLVTIRPKGLVIQVAKFTRDGTRIVTLGAGEVDGRLWNADGSGGFVSMPAGRGEVRELYPSASGRWLLATSAEQTAQLYPLDPNDAIAAFRNARTCMTVAERQRYLTESAPDATTRYRACETSRRGTDTTTTPAR